MPAKLKLSLLASALVLTIAPMSAMAGPATGGGNIGLSSRMPSMGTTSARPTPSHPGLGVAQRPGLSGSRAPATGVEHGPAVGPTIVTGSRIPVTTRRPPDRVGTDDLQPVSPIQDPLPRDKPADN